MFSERLTIETTALFRLLEDLIFYCSKFWNTIPSNFNRNHFSYLNLSSSWLSLTEKPSCRPKVTPSKIDGRISTLAGGHKSNELDMWPWPEIRCFNVHSSGHYGKHGIPLFNLISRSQYAQMLTLFLPTGLYCESKPHSDLSNLISDLSHKHWPYQSCPLTCYGPGCPHQTSPPPPSRCQVVPRGPGTQTPGCRGSTCWGCSGTCPPAPSRKRSCLGWTSTIHPQYHCQFGFAELKFNFPNQFHHL